MDKSREDKYERAYRRAVEIMDQEWLAAGFTEEDLERWRQEEDEVAGLLAAGHSTEDIQAYYESKYTTHESGTVEKSPRARKTRRAARKPAVVPQ